jgi:hypothetical protein
LSLTLILRSCWLDLIEGFEDHRRYRHPDDGEKSFLVMAAQSFVIDCKVQEKLKERGFSMRPFAEDVVVAPGNRRG